MESFKVLSVAGKDVDGEKSVKNALEDFKAVENPIQSFLLLLLPWLIFLFLIFFILFKFEAFKIEWTVAGVLMYISGMLAAAFSLFAFQVLMKMIPETFGKIWCRNILLEAPFSYPLQIIAVGKDSEVAALEIRQTEARFLQFIQKLQKKLNSPYQWVMGLFFTMMVYTWDWVYKFEFLIALIIGLMAWRAVIASIYVWKLGTEFHLEPLLGHADRSGGLSPLGNLCLWNAFIITIPEIHLGGWILLSFFAEKDSSFFEISRAYAPLYLLLLFVFMVFALVTFFLPLWTVHRVMLEWSNRKLAQLDQLEHCIHHLESRLLNEAEKLDQKEFERIQKEVGMMQQIYERNKNLPVWPFNMTIKLKLLVSQIIPYMGFISQVVSLIKKISG